MRSYGQYCALGRALDHIGHRWTLLIVRELLLGPKRFTDLRDGLPGIANNLLADRLNHLQDDGLVTRRELPPPAASTVYELTEPGRELREAIDALIRWGGRWMTTGRQGDEFRVDWLALALDALGTVTIKSDTMVELDIDGESVCLAVRNHHLSIIRTPQEQPDLRIIADAPTILGLAAGQITVSQARDIIELEPDTPEATATFEQIFSRAD